MVLKKIDDFKFFFMFILFVPKDFFHDHELFLQVLIVFWKSSAVWQKIEVRFRYLLQLLQKIQKLLRELRKRSN